MGRKALDIPLYGLEECLSFYGLKTTNDHLKANSFAANVSNGLLTCTCEECNASCSNTGKRSSSLCYFSLSRAHKLKPGRGGFRGKGVSRGTRRSSWFSLEGKLFLLLEMEGNRDADRRCADEPIDTKNTKIPNGNC